MHPDIDPVAESGVGCQHGYVAAQCIHEMAVETCGICRPRPGQIDLHRSDGSRGVTSAFEDEVVRVEYIEGDPYGLVPSDGEVYCQGSGDVLHHRTECSSLAGTSAERLMRYQDDDGMTWWNLIQGIPWRQGRGIASRQKRAQELGLLNAEGKPVSSTCTECVLRPRAAGQTP
jgi:hypothetical protein